MVDIIFQNFKTKEKRKFIKETRKPMQSTETYRRAKDREYKDKLSSIQRSMLQV